MNKYTVDFKHQAVMHFYRIRSQQLTADAFRMSRTHLRRWIAAYEHGGLAALEHPQAMADKKTNPFIADKPDKEKTQDELLQEVGYLRAEVAYLKKLEALFPQKTATPKKRKSSKH